MGLLDLFIAKDAVRGGHSTADDFGKVLIANTLFGDEDDPDAEFEEMMFLDAIGFFDDEEDEDD